MKRLNERAFRLQGERDEIYRDLNQSSNNHEIRECEYGLKLNQDKINENRNDRDRYFTNKFNEVFRR